MKSRLDRALHVLPIIVSVTALIFSVYVYLEVTRPHTRFEETLSKLNLLEKAIHDAEESLQALERLNPNASRYWPYIYQAKRLYVEARSKLIEGDYEEAERLIREAITLLNQVPLLPPPPWPLIAGVMIAVVVAAIVIAVMLVMSKRREVSS